MRRQTTSPLSNKPSTTSPSRQKVRTQTPDRSRPLTCMLTRTFFFPFFSSNEQLTRCIMESAASRR